MKFGVKTYFGEDFLDHFKDKADFFEVQGLRNKNYNFIKKYSLPIVVHSEHYNQGSNPASTRKYKTNLKSINYARKVSNLAKGKKIILHPGLIENKSCSYENAIKFIKKIKDKRIIIENMPNYGNRFCTTPKEIKEFMKETGKGFNFDLAHCMMTANKMKVNQTKMIKDFIKLKPDHFHISGQMIRAMRDQHKALTNCNLNWKKILSLYPKNAEITLEVTVDIKKTEKDLEMIKRIAKSIN